MDFFSRVNQLKVDKNSVAIIWIGQAGFIIKTHGGKLIVIDPYLSDLAHRNLKSEYGDSFKRLVPALFDAKEISFDTILISHEHPDHLDLDSLPALLNNKKTLAYMNKQSMQIARNVVSDNRLRLLERTEQYEFSEFTLTCMIADHGEDTPNALGFLLDFGFVKIYYAGDTCYNQKAFEAVCAQQPEICILPINGAFGNLDAKQAFSLASDLKSRICIPSHYWMLSMHNGNPQDFLNCFDKTDKCKAVLLCQGETFAYESR